MWAPGYEYLRQALVTTEHVLLASNGRDAVYHCPKLNVVLKRRQPKPKPKHQVRREYDVGILINEYNNPNMVKILGCFMSRNVAYIITEYVPGVTLRKLQPELRTKELYLQIFDALRNAQEQMNFTHYDLHPDNIIIEDNGNIRFIDFARSHVRGVQPGWYETAIIDGATCPGIFDPMFDYARVVMDIGNLDAPMREMFDSNYFDSREEVGEEYWGIPGYPRVMFYDGDLNENDIAWVSTTETLNGFAADYKTLEKICLGEKQRQIQMRRNTPEEFYQACLDFVSRKLS